MSTFKCFAATALAMVLIVISGCSSSSPGLDTINLDIPDVVTTDATDVLQDITADSRIDVIDVIDVIDPDVATEPGFELPGDVVEPPDSQELPPQCQIAAECDDEDLCTTDDCVDLRCVNVLLACDDSNGCTADTCDPATGGCIFTAIPDCQPICSGTADCDDLDNCTVDSCIDNACVHSDLTCDDLDICTNDYCYAETGCVNAAIPDCEQPACELDDDCNDNLMCTTEICDMETSTCVYAQAVCDDNDTCTVDSCLEGTGCVNTWNDQCGCDGNNDCDDNNACTTETCESLDCVYVTTNCNDGNPCTLDSCVAPTGCVNELINPCDPGCTADTDCDDDNVCTADSCDLTGEKGVCINVAAGAFVVGGALNCDDGNACTGGDNCVDGNCQGTFISCNDNDPCTTDSCDPAKGCLNIVEGPPCGICTTAAQCDDENACTTDTCQPSGECLHTEISCNDNNPCTVDSCKLLPDGTSFCSNAAAEVDTPCDDGKICTVGDKCVAGTCTSGTGNYCNDDLACTVDKCAAATGVCTHSSVSCDDKNPCTRDVCLPDGPGTPFCRYFTNPAGTPCNDGNICTVGDSCSGQKCTVTTGLLCDDKNGCTTDFCDAVTGECTHTPVSCNDSRPCTIDTCKVDATGTPYCVYSAVSNGSPCNDLNPCTMNDKCLSRNCVGVEADCNDNDECTNDFCDPLEGCSHTILPGCTGCTSALDCDDLDPITCDCCCDVSSSTRCVSVVNPLPEQPCDCTLLPGCS
jgi:hypothetical protein